MNIRKLRSWHKYLSLYFGIAIFFYALSGIILNHRALFSGIEINRKFLPSNYELKHWNQGMVRSKINLNGNQRVVFGNMGAWLTDKNYTKFSDFNQGLPHGIDYRKSFDLIKTSGGELYLGTEHGLYFRSTTHGIWKKISAPILHNKRIYSLEEIEGRIYFGNRNAIFSFQPANKSKIIKHVLIPPKGNKNNLSLFRTLWFIHSGEIFGAVGKLIVDFLSILMMVLIFSGFFFILYKFVKKKQLLDTNLTKVKVHMRNFHLKIGSVLAVFFIVLAITGSFLRPPFLILISSIEVPKIPGTYFSNDNPWFEKLRGFYYDKQDSLFYIFTGKGEIYQTTSLDNPITKIEMVPPISIMGVNHFSKISNQKFLVGSFSGLFEWDMRAGTVTNYFTRKPFEKPKKPAPPVSDHLLAGFFTEDGNDYYFDFSQGNTVFNNGVIPEKISKSMPMSLWTLALEVHTGRIFSQYLGPFFLLYVPFSGIILTLILLAGLLLWFKGYRKKSRKKTLPTI